MRIIHDHDVPSGVQMSTEELLVLCALLGLPEPLGLGLTDHPASLGEQRSALQAAARSLVASGLVRRDAEDSGEVAGIPAPLAALVSVTAQAHLHAFIVRGDRHQLEWWHLAERDGAAVEHTSSPIGVQTLTPLLGGAILDRLVEIAIPDADTGAAASADDDFTLTLGQLQAAAVGSALHPKEVTDRSRGAAQRFARALSSGPVITSAQMTARSGSGLIGLEEAWLDDEDGSVWVIPSPLSVGWADRTVDLGSRQGEEWVVGRRTRAQMAELLRSGPGAEMADSSERASVRMPTPIGAENGGSQAAGSPS